MENGTCEVCKKKKPLTRHHIQWESMGGRYKDNSEYVCNKCHTMFHMNEGQSGVTIKRFLKVLDSFIKQNLLSVVKNWKRKDIIEGSKTQKNKFKKVITLISIHSGKRGKSKNQRRKELKKEKRRKEEARKAKKERKEEKRKNKKRTKNK